MRHLKWTLRECYEQSALERIVWSPEAKDDLAKGMRPEDGCSLVRLGVD